MISLIIDERKVEIEEGSSVLDAARKAGIQIPTLCYHKALKPYGSCRVCLVEIARKDSSTLQASCTYPAQPGLIVRTSTERVIHARTVTLELLLARCPESKEVRRVAGEWGVSDTTFPKRDKDCILCGRCVRMCEERMGRAAIGFVGRGSNKEVATPFGSPSEVCQVCGACDFICPTGRIDLSSVSTRKPRPILSEYNERLTSRPAIFIPSPQAVPNLAVIDREHCARLLGRPCEVCKEFCEAGAIRFDQQEEKEAIDVGAIILAPGVDRFGGIGRGEYGFGRYENVVSNIQFERMLSASGPNEGEVLRPSDARHPRSIAFVQCVGSRDAVTGNKYCSSFCCMAAIKEAILAREHNPEMQVTIFCMDVRAFGKGFDRFYERAKKQYGIEFVRGMISRIAELPRTKNLRVSFVPDEGERRDREFDMVVLSMGFRPDENLRRTAERLKLNLDEFGFCQTSPLEPVRTSREGVFVAGVFQEPKDIPETVMQGSGAAACALELLSGARGTLVTEKVYPPERDFTDATPRIGVFVCHCGTNIASVVNVNHVVEAAEKQSFVEHAEANIYTCADNSQEHIKQVVEEKNLNRILVASCTPRTHLALFRETAREVGINPFLVEMANIREQCSWVHSAEPEAATRKAIDLMRMAVARTARLTPRMPEELPVTKAALVVGGGPSGMTAALSLAAQGFEVHLVEKEDELGGGLRDFHYTLEGDDVAAFRERLTQAVSNHPGIESHLGSQLTSIEGHAGDFSSQVLTGDGRSIEIKHGVLIVATGGKELKPQQYLYGEDARVLTQRELETRIAASEHVAQNGDTIVMIQCVGSRDDDHPYCSRVCCAQAVKNALRIKDRSPDATVIVLYRDMRTYGFHEIAYQKAREAGVLFFRYDPEAPPVVSGGTDLMVEFDDPITGRRKSLHTDLLVLSTGIVPGEDNPEISELAKLPLDEDGFFLEAHLKLRPVDFASEGIFLCGLAHSPKFLKENIFQALAAAGRAATVLSKDSLVIGGEIAWVDSTKCVSCLTCTRVCPYGAPSISLADAHRRIEIDPAKCMGCGSCAAECPAMAIQLHNFLDSQIAAAIMAMMETR